MVSTATDLTTLQSADVDIGTHFHDFQVLPPPSTHGPHPVSGEKKKRVGSLVFIGNSTQHLPLSLCATLKCVENV